MRLLILCLGAAESSAFSFAPYPADASTATAAEPSGGQPIFPAGHVPGEHPGAIGNESWSGAYGGSFFDVTVPALYPRLVPNATTAVIVNPGGACACRGLKPLAPIGESTLSLVLHTHLGR